MEIRSRYKCPPVPGEEPGKGKRMVETGGYIPPEVQIEEMIFAGRRLGEYRKENYDFGADEEIPDDYVDPTRSPGFDMADASAIKSDLKTRLQRLKDAQAALKKKAEEDKSEEKPEAEKPEAK